MILSRVIPSRVILAAAMPVGGVVAWVVVKVAGAVDTRGGDARGGDTRGDSRR